MQYFNFVGRKWRVDQWTTYLPAATQAKQTKITTRLVMARLKEARVELIGAFRDGRAWRGHLVRLADLTTAGWAVRASHDRD